ncbi:hypothetical protein T440DRAFT_403686 [Plenodomus tracheiphilus IPT5]|uniref:Uncharacterized protein n=1 Tax=Plenodomus tracheiphilus IPT5 TaxID=1408161 RepID=A0A6A7AZ22_9PLEO|nr:hypothetical protein T440DRAFT_403686 [Plenodomus tracheiphilus IPT5]
MKYAFIFAATAAASYDAYGAYPENPTSSSASVKPSTSAKPIGYTTLYPGYGKEPVTVTSQYQPYPTCVSPGYGGKDCAKWEADKYVSTTIKDCDQKDVVITMLDQPVMVYHAKTTITHSATGKYGSSTSSAGYAQPTGAAYKNGTEGCWYELYERIEEVPYRQLGSHALRGYGGSGLFAKGDVMQPVYVKEYKDGKWFKYEHTYSYGKPEPEVVTYEKPGVYIVPGKDVTVDHPVVHPAEATKTAYAGETCTYGGQYIDAKETGYVTAAYGAYEVKVQGDKTVTETVVSYTTLWVSSTGEVEIAKPTTTVYDHDTEIPYPTAKAYAPGVYHYDAQTVTVTQGGEAYTCKYEQTKKYDATPKGNNYPAYPTATPVKVEDYGYKSSATPSTPAGGEKYPVMPSKPAGGEKYPVYPVKGNGSYEHGKEAYPAASTPVAIYSKGYENGHAYEDYPHPAATPAYNAKPYNGEHTEKSSSTPCPSSTLVKPSVYTPVYGHPEATPSAPPSVYAPVYGHPEATPSAPAPAKSSPVYPDEPYNAKPTPVKPSAVYPAEPYQAQPTPVNPAEPSGAKPQQNQAYGGGYGKRDNMMERRAHAL